MKFDLLVYQISKTTQMQETNLFGKYKININSIFFLVHLNISGFLWKINCKVIKKCTEIWMQAVALKLNFNAIILVFNHIYSQINWKFNKYIILLVNLNLDFQGHFKVNAILWHNFYRKLQFYCIQQWSDIFLIF